jgi:hypothetical protein
MLTSHHAVRLLRVTGAAEDRGDTPVPSAIIIAGLAVLALVLVGWVFYLGGEFMGQVDGQLPEAPAPVPGG